MLNITRAYLWELWSIDRRNLFFTLAIVIGFGSLLIFMSRLLEVDNNETTGTAYMLALVFAIINAGNVKLGEDGNGFPLSIGFARPIPTVLLALLPLFYLALSRVLMFSLPIIVFNIVFTADLPLFPTVWRIFALSIVLTVFFWWTKNKVIDFAFALVGFIVFLLINIQPYVNLVGAGREEFKQKIVLLISQPFSLSDYLQMIIWITLASALLVYGVVKQRQGEWVEGNTGLFNQLATSLKISQWIQCPIHSPINAELWREFRYKGTPVLVASVASASVISVIAFLIKAFASNEAKDAPFFDSVQIFIIFLLMLAGMMVCLSIGANRIFDIRQKGSVSSISLFDATRALPTASLLSLKLLSMSFWSMLAWGIIFLSFCLNAAMLSEHYGLSTYWGFLLAPVSHYTWYQMAAKSLVWCVYLATIVVFFGVIQTFVVVNGKTMAIFTLGGLGALIYVAAIASYGLDSGLPLILMHAIAGLLIMLGVIAYLFVLVCKDKILTVVKAILLAAIWAAYAGIYAYALTNQQDFLANATAGLVIWKIMLSLTPLLVLLAAYRVFFLFRHQ